MIAAATVGNTIADQVYYQIARNRGREAFARKAAGDPRYERIRRWIDRRGAALLFVSRFLYGFRIAIPAACGAAGMPPGLFFAVNLLGGLSWALVTGLAGYAFGETVALVLADVRRVELLLAAALVAGSVFLLARRRNEPADVLAILRRPATLVLDAAPVLFTAGHRLGRLALARPHARLATLVVLLGCLNLASALFGWRFLHLDRFEVLLPLEVVHGSRALMAFAGLLLVGVGRLLARRKRVAWCVAITASAASALLYLTHDAGVFRAAGAAALAFELWRQRAWFNARSDPARVRRAAPAAALLALLISAYGVALWNDLAPGSSDLRSSMARTWRAAAFMGVETVPGANPREARALVRSLRLLGGVSAIYLLALVVAPVVARREPGVDRALVGRLAWQYGHDSVSCFAKQDDKLHEVHREGGDAAFLGYRVVGRVAVVVGDPVGPDAAVRGAIRHFADRCATNDWVPVFYEASDRYLDAYRSVGLRFFKVGEEAVIPLASFSLAGGKVAKVRQFINKVERENPDLVVSEYRRDPPDPGIDAQLEEISEEWLTGKAGGELGFNLGVFSLEALSDTRTIVASTADGRVCAFLTWLPYRGGRALVLDAMRRRDDAPAGVMELLIARAALRFKDEGIEAISLATAPLASVDDTGAGTAYDKGVRLVFDHFSGFYGYRSLFQFKKKFNPMWEGRYLVFPRPDLLPRVVWALVRVHTTASVLDWLRR